MTENGVSIREQTPVLRRGCRLREENEATAILMIPEGILKLSPGGLRVIRLCDGSRSVAKILSELKAEHPPTLAERIERETLAYLERLVEKQVLSFL